MNSASTQDHDDEKADKQTDEVSTDDNDGAPAPFAPDSDDDSALGDTDEHSDA